MKSQMQMFYEESHKIAEACVLFNEFVKDGLTRNELQRLINKRPALWGRFSNWLDKLPSELPNHKDFSLASKSGYMDL